MTLSGNPWDYVSVFFAGVVLSFTPCVYPLLPVTAGYIGVAAKGSKLKGLFLSFLYVTGLALTYSALGLIAALTGKMFGRISSHPVTLLAVGIIFVLLGLSMFKVFAVYFPAVSRLSQVKNKGGLSALALGMVSGLVASPCVAPALVAILAYLATTRNVVYGATLLMVFAYGMGLTLILIGIFSTALLHLPKSGRWMIYIERICALVLIGVGIYFIFNAVRSI
ncbi:MAG: sulfite exporter TauE/SafE family protein [Candidatus Omnitrophica bacterium]|nr:sulfite exporter TauE/SafE family protein [Candidatus Omnitrophota bacterium]